jgi:RimJ/RimL family protein N-acetyltransferase
VVVPPPYRIETERLVVRCWEPRDAGLLKEAVDSSIDHLRPWILWIQHEPQELDQKVELLRGFRGAFDLGTDFAYALFPPDESRVMGGSGLHRRSDESTLEIGYWLRPTETGAGLMTEAVAALTTTAFRMCKAERVDIRVDTRNERSLALPRRLGYTEDATLRRRLPPILDGAPPGDVVVFSMFAEEVAGSPAAEVPFTAYDAAGRELRRARDARGATRRAGSRAAARAARGRRLRALGTDGRPRGHVVPAPVAKRRARLHGQAGRRPERRGRIRGRAPVRAERDRTAEGRGGDLSRVTRIVRVEGHVGCAPDFSDIPAVLNGASDLVNDVFGERGRHARTVLGHVVMPLDAAVMIGFWAEVSSAA